MIQFRLNVITLTCLATVSVALIGCGTSRTVSVPGGKATVTEQGDTTKTEYNDMAGNKVETETDGDDYKATITDKDGNTATYEGGANGDFKDTGLNPYPNTFTVENKSTVTKMERAGNTVVSAVIFTKDAPEKVVEHFKKQLDEVESELSSGDYRMISGTKGERQISVSVTKEEEGTQAYVSSYTKKED